MLTNYLMKGRRYAPLQILAVCLVSTGIILATFSTPPRHPKPSSSSFSSETADRSGVTEIDFEYLLGVAILLSALVISAVMGLYQETTYKKWALSSHG
jgi:solute carrier family 35 (UDP-xylose/UDP-N-acetylglucosamine transporter), member B4